MAQNGEIRTVTDSTQSIIKKTQRLKGVSVVASVPKTKLRGDAMVTRVVGSSVANAGSAEDALARIPGLINMQGKINVIGKGEPTYYINGRKVHDVTELQRLSSHDIKEVEVINNPGAMYDAQTHAVVRIITLRRRGEGFGITLEASDEYGPSYGNNRLGTQVGLSYRINSLEVFGGMNFDDHYLAKYKSLTRQESYGTNNFVQDGYLDHSQHYNGIKYNLGADWQFADNHSVGFKVERNDNLLGKSDFLMDEEVFQNDNSIDHLVANTHTDADGVNSWLGNAYYSGKVGKLTIDGNVDLYKTDQTQTATTLEDDMAASRTVIAESNAKNNLFATKWVFSYPVGYGKISAGTEMAFMNRDNKYNIDEKTIASDLSTVNEDTYAAFAEYSTLIPMAGMLNVGLRYEHVSFDYDNKLNDANDLSRKYDNIFPSVSFGTQVGELQAMVSYAVKTQRPYYNTLRSNIEYNNRFTLSTGDPKLKNEINHEWSLGARYTWLAMQVNYSHKKNGIYDWTEPYDDNGRVMLKWVNFDKPIDMIGAYVNATPTIGHWSPNWTVGIQKQWLKFNLNDPREATGMREVKYNKPMFIFISNNTYSFPTSVESEHGPWQLELNSEFLSNFHWGNAEIKNCYWDLTFAVQKSWFNQDALSVRLSFSDIFKTAYHDVRIDLGNYVLTQSHINGQERSSYDKHRIKLSVRYKFNATKSKYKGTGAGKEIRERM